MSTETSSSLLERARQVIPGGVNSPVRAFAAVEGDPPFIVRGEGCTLIDEDGNRYVDLIGSWGPLILGHAHPSVLAAVQAAAAEGTSFGAPTRAEVLFAEELVDAHPTLEMVRLCSLAPRRRCTRSGWPAVHRPGPHHQDRRLLPRRPRQRPRGCGSGVATFAQPGSPGSPAPRRAHPDGALQRRRRHRAAPP